MRGPRVLSKRGTETDDGPAFVVEDGNYVSARWPGDAYLFAKRFAARLEVLTSPAHRVAAIVQILLYYACMRSATLIQQEA